MGITPSGKAYLNLKGYSSWERKILRRLYDKGGDDAVHAVEYILAKGIHIKIGEQIKNVRYSRGGWGIDGDLQTIGDVSGWYEGNDYVVLDPEHNTYEEMPDNWSLATIVHETIHIEQGLLVASSKDGELEAYQVGLRVFMKLEGKTLSQLDAYQQDMYNSTSGWDYGQKVKMYLPGYWWGLRLLPPYFPPSP